MFSQSSQVINSNHGFSLKMLVTPTRHYSCKYSLVLSHFIPSCFNTTCCCANTTYQRSIGLSRRHTLSHKQIFSWHTIIQYAIFKQIVAAHVVWSFDLPKSGVSDWLCYVSQAFVSSRKDQKTLTWEDAAFVNETIFGTFYSTRCWTFTNGSIGYYNMYTTIPLTWNYGTFTWIILPFAKVSHMFEVVQNAS